MDCTAVDCASCEPPAAARCVNHTCQDGQASAADCADFSCLAGAGLVYYQTAEWYEPAGGVPGMGDEIVLDARNYVKRMGLPALALHFSGDAAQVEMTQMPTGDTTRGTRDLTHTDVAWYTLEAFAGGRFVVTLDAGRLHGEYTLYGSGRPVIFSTVGYIE